MTDKHPGLPVAGYRPQNQAAVDAVNANKLTEEKILRLIDDLQNGTLNGEAFQADGRWLSIARTQIEQGFMALNRSIFKPERVAL